VCKSTLWIMIFYISCKVYFIPLLPMGYRPYISMILIGTRLLGSEAFYSSSSGNVSFPNSHPQSQQISPSSHGMHCVEPQSGQRSIMPPAIRSRKRCISRCGKRFHPRVSPPCFLQPHRQLLRSKCQADRR